MERERYQREKPYHEPGWQSLANAIVEMTAKDLMNAFKHYKNKSDREVRIQTRDEYKFFFSDWCKMLTDVDGDAIVRGIRKRAWGD